MYIYKKQLKERKKLYCKEFGYDPGRNVDEIRPGYTFDISSQVTVPQAIRAFIDSSDFEDAIRTAVSLGGDSDTLACITGGVAQALYGAVPEDIQKRVYSILDDRLGKDHERIHGTLLRRLMNGAVG